MTRLPLILAIVMAAGVAKASLRFRSDASGRTTAIYGLANDSACLPFKFSGRVVKRGFADDALTVTNFVVENRDGTRTFINVEIPADLSPSDRQILDDGLQRLLKDGRTVDIGAIACGAAGRVILLNDLR